MRRFNDGTWMTYDLMTRTRYNVCKPESRLDSGFVALFSTYKDGKVCQKTINQMVSEQSRQTELITKISVIVTIIVIILILIIEASPDFFVRFYCKQIQWNKLLVDIIIVLMI